MESTEEEMKSFAGTQVTDTFPIYIPDPKSNYAIYKDFGSQRKVAGSMLGCGACFHMCYDCKFYWAMACFGANPSFGCPLMNPKGFKMLMCNSRGLLTHPTDVLIDEDENVADVWYGKAIGDHMEMSKVEQFAGSASSPAVNPGMER